MAYVEEIKTYVFELVHETVLEGTRKGYRISTVNVLHDVFVEFFGKEIDIKQGTLIEDTSGNSPNSMTILRTSVAQIQEWLDDLKFKDLPSKFEKLNWNEPFSRNRSMISGLKYLLQTLLESVPATEEILGCKPICTLMSVYVHFLK